MQKFFCLLAAVGLASCSSTEPDPDPVSGPAFFAYSTSGAWTYLRRPTFLLTTAEHFRGLTPGALVDSVALPAEHEDGSAAGIVDAFIDADGRAYVVGSTISLGRIESGVIQLGSGYVHATDPQVGERVSGHGLLWRVERRDTDEQGNARVTMIAQSGDTTFTEIYSVGDAGWSNGAESHAISVGGVVVEDYLRDSYRE